RAGGPVAEAQALRHAERECGADRQADLACRGPYGSAHQRARFQRARGRRLPAARAGVRARSALHDQEVTSHTRPGSLHEPGRPPDEWGGPLRPFHHLYVHIPFCKHKCGYCDFNAYAGMDRLMPDYVDALERELRFAHERYAFQQLETVYLGGGTPSLLPADLMSRLLGFIRRTFNVASDAEVTLEANPGSTDEARVAAWLDGGVNRLSLGVQGFDPRALAVLERKTDGAQAKRAYAQARAAGFANINLDLIFGVPFQDLRSWSETVKRATALGPEHLSCYALTFEPDTLLTRRRNRGLLPEVESDLQWDQLDAADHLLAEAGYRRYEVSNWSRPG